MFSDNVCLLKIHALHLHVMTYFGEVITTYTSTRNIRIPCCVYTHIVMGWDEFSCLYVKTQIKPFHSTLFSIYAYEGICIPSAVMMLLIKLIIKLK